MVAYRINAYLNKLQLIGVLSKRDTRNPSAADWSYPVPTLWINTASDSAYLLVDNTENGAVWTEIVPSESSFTQGNDALAIYDITTAVPGAPSAGDAYILSATGVRDVSWTNLGATYKDFVIYDGSSWKVSTPMGGSIVYVDSLKELFIYADSTWKSFHELMPFDFQESVLSIADNTAPPPTEVTGDRYILDTTGGGVNAGWDGASTSDLVEFDGVVWHAMTPTEGMMTSVEDVNTVYIYVAGWSPLITSTALLVNADTGTFEPNGSGEMSILGDSTSGINVVGDNANTGTVSADQASTTQRGTLETATDGEAQAKTDAERALTASNLAALGSSETFAGLIEIATDAEADAGTATDKALVPSNLPTAVPAQMPAASTTVQGKIEIATDGEAQAKTDTGRALVPSNLAALGASETFSGLIEIATDAEAIAKTATDKALVPSNIAALVPWTVANGGSGRASHTAYAVICGGTTSTGAQQSVASVGTAGQILTSNGAALPTFQDAPAGAIPWTEVTGTSQSAAVENGYIANNASLVTITLPSTAAIGDRVRVVGKGAGLFKIGQNASQLINFIDTVTTTGTGGSLTAIEQYASIEMICITANTTWAVLSSTGNFEVV